MSRPIRHVAGFDDAPFPPECRGDVAVVGAVFCDLRLEGILRGRVRRDGRNATEVIAGLVNQSRYQPQLQCLMLQGIALAGFNVVDIQKLHETTGLPVIALVRKPPDLEAIRRALLGKVKGGQGKWRLIERAGPMESVAGVYIQRAGIGRTEAGSVIEALAVNSRIPEPLRTAHLVASALSAMPSRQRV